VHVRVSEHVCTCKLFLMPSVLVFMFVTEIMSFPMLMFITINMSPDSDVLTERRKI